MDDNKRQQRSNLREGWGILSTHFDLKPKKRGPKPKPKPKEDQVVAKRKPGPKPRKKAEKEVCKKKRKTSSQTTTQTS